MKVLKWLYIVSHNLDRFLNLSNLDATIALQMEWNPPSIGCNLVTKLRPKLASIYTSGDSLLTVAIEEGNVPAIIKLIRAGCSLTAPIPKTSACKGFTSALRIAIKNENAIKFVKVK